MINPWPEKAFYRLSERWHDPDTDPEFVRFDRHAGFRLRRQADAACVDRSNAETTGHAARSAIQGGER